MPRWRKAHLRKGRRVRGHLMRVSIERWPPSRAGAQAYRYMATDTQRERAEPLRWVRGSRATWLYPDGHEEQR
jgi:hypothetical protein